jgi:hypothetical protein
MEFLYLVYLIEFKTNYYPTTAKVKFIDEGEILTGLVLMNRIMGHVAWLEPQFYYILAAWKAITIFSCVITYHIKLL